MPGLLFDVPLNRAGTKQTGLCFDARRAGDRKPPMGKFPQEA